MYFFHAPTASGNFLSCEADGLPYRVPPLVLAVELERFLVLLDGAWRSRLAIRHSWPAAKCVSALMGGSSAVSKALRRR